MRIFANIGHGLEKIVVDGCLRSGQNSVIFYGFNARAGGFAALDNQAFFAVNFIFETLQAAAVCFYHIGLPFAKIAQGKYFPGRGQVMAHAAVRGFFQQAANCLTLFHRAAGDAVCHRAGNGLRYASHFPGKARGVKSIVIRVWRLQVFNRENPFRPRLPGCGVCRIWQACVLDKKTTDKYCGCEYGETEFTHRFIPSVRLLCGMQPGLSSAGFNFMHCQMFSNALHFVKKSRPISGWIF